MIEKAILAKIGKYQDGIIPREYQLIVLDGATLIGRKAKSEDATVIFNIKDGHISRQHAVIYPSKDDNWEIKDLDSTNGTFINGERISLEPIQLDKGDIIGIGSKDISFQFEKTLLNPNHVLLCYATLNTDGTKNKEGLEVVSNFKDKIVPYGFDENIGELVDETRRKLNLFSWFNMVKRYCTNESISLIYIVGHGVDDEYLGLHREGESTVRLGLTITYAQLFYWLSSVRGNKLLILDECIPITENEKISSRTMIIMNPYSESGEKSHKAMGPFLQNLPDTLINNDFYRIIPERPEDFSHDLGDNIIVRYQGEGYFNTTVIEFKIQDKEFDVSEFNRTVKLERDSF
ncbi:FHA domain-containing protein [Thermodesulfobacteriota bacterium]